MEKKKLAIVLGVRPDVIRASLILNQIRTLKEFETVFLWSGQHYSDNLKDIFFRELEIKPPEIDLHVTGDTDAEISSSIHARLYTVLQQLRPQAAVFLGDTNTVLGCLAAAQLNIPIVHIEGCLRSYDWRMPEEKYRRTIDHLSDVIYAYFEEHRQQGISEGLSAKNIVVVQNLMVDVLDAYYFQKKSIYDAMATDAFFRHRGLERQQYYVMTCHRRENVHIEDSFRNILSLLHHIDRTVYFVASYRTQKVLKEYDLTLPSHILMVDPIGHREMLALLVHSRGLITDSGTMVEESCILQVPSLQIRHATERPQVYDAGSSVKFDPLRADRYPYEQVLEKFDTLYGRSWEHGFGDGHASERIVADLAQRMQEDGFRRHRPEDYPYDTRRSYREDGLL